MTGASRPGPGRLDEGAARAVNVGDAVNPHVFAGEVAVLHMVSAGRYELSARKQQGPARSLVAFNAET